ncbi:MAG: iron (metal) dependent repressor DtxR family protein [Candidatus Scalindua rubra]|uniref:Iron (Metal) dependent repressor DtxR family protein n=1 Tax=Candidatus Scalindua rubra TaxID=1872076 RepID=A0A1E3X3Z8_9BACT|nr:MAG: iron (metal) dependent repressor DtxR family protein [Candidatus Scalindua rubra]
MTEHKGEETLEHIWTLIVSLSELRSGDACRVVYIVTKFQDRSDIISGIGILPGIELKVHQRIPAFVLQIRQFSNMNIF